MSGATRVPMRLGLNRLVEAGAHADPLTPLSALLTVDAARWPRGCGCPGGNATA